MSESDNLNQVLAETWQKIPEEERVLLLAQTKAQAVEASCLLVVAGLALATSFKSSGIILCTLALIPLVYQVVSTRVWHQVKPLTTAKYFVASATSRLYAQSLQSRDLSLKLIFRGSLQAVPVSFPEPEQNEFIEELNDHKPAPRDVWISLFPDALVMFAEGSEGAELAFGHSTLKNFEVALDTPEDSDDDSQPSRLIIQTTHNDAVESRWIVNSAHTTTLRACERKIRFFNQKASGQTAAQL